MRRLSGREFSGITRVGLAVTQGVAKLGSTSLLGNLMIGVTRNTLKSCLLMLSLLALDLHAATVGDDKASAIKGHSRVVLAEFGVEFYTQLHAEGRSGGANAQVTSELGGVSDATFQAITDQAYADTVAALTKAGFEVVDSAQMRQNPIYQQLESKYGAASPMRYDDQELFKGAPSVSQVYAPAGMKAFFSSGVARGNLGQRIDVQNYARGMKEGDLAKALNATILHVHYLSSFGMVSGTKNNALLAGVRGAKAEFEARPVLFPNDTEMQFVTEAGPRTYTTSHRGRHSGAVFLKDPLYAPKNIFSMVDTTSAASKKSDAAGKAMGLLFGRGSSKHKTDRVIPSSEADFQATYSALIRDAAASLSQSLAAARG